MNIAATSRNLVLSSRRVLQSPSDYFNLPLDRGLTLAYSTYWENVRLYPGNASILLAFFVLLAALPR